MKGEDRRELEERRGNKEKRGKGMREWR